MMAFDDLVKALRSRYESATNNAVLSIHLFGIEFAEALEGHSLHDLAEAATGHRSYGAELNKARNIAPHVTLKD